MNFADGDWKPQRITRAVGVTALQASLPANLRRRKPAAQHLIYMDENCCAVKHAPPMWSRSGSGTDKRTAYRASARGIGNRPDLSDGTAFLQAVWQSGVGFTFENVQGRAV